MPCELLYMMTSFHLIVMFYNRAQFYGTPLCCASQYQNNTEAVELLLEAGAEVNPSSAQVNIVVPKSLAL